MKYRYWAILLACFFALPASAVDKKDPKDQLKRMQQAQRKLEQEKNQISQEKAALDGQLKEAEGQLDDSRKQAGAASRKASALARDLTALQAEKEVLTTKLADTEQRLRKLEELQLTTDTERRRLDTLSAQLKQSLAACETKNETLYKQGSALLKSYEQKGCFDTLSQKEPFTGLKQVEMENQKEESQELMDEARIAPSGR